MKDIAELFLVTGTSFSSMLAYHYWSYKNVILQFSFWLIPQYLVIVWPKCVYILNSILGLITFFLFLKSYLKKLKIENTELTDISPMRENLEENKIKTQFTEKEVLNHKSTSLGKYYPVIDSYRAYLLLMVVISILACDFTFFPVRFYKTDFFGYSLMDIGIGAFLLNGGALAHKMKLRKLIQTCCTLFLLGLLRLYVVIGLKYSVNITEYGKHLNFYFVLCFTYLIFYFINTKHNFKLGIIIMMGYEYILVIKKYNVFIFEEIRNTLFLQNKEGIFQIIPSLCIFLFSSTIGKLTDLKNEKDKINGLFKYTFVYILGFVIAKEYCLPSRRLGNTTYVMWIMALHSLHLAFSFIVSHSCKFTTLEIHEFISKHMMFLFLWANLLVLIINCAIDTKKLYYGGHFVMLFYLIMTFVVPFYLVKMYNGMGRVKKTDKIIKLT